LTTTQAPPVAADEKVVPLRHPWRWVGAALLTLLAVMLVEGAATNEALRWDVVGRYLFDEQVIEGLWMTIRLTVFAMLIGIVLGVALAVMRLSGNPVLRGASTAYAAVFRGVPIVVQLLFWFYLSAVLPKVGLGIPWGPTFVEADTNRLITQFGAALLGLGLHEAAYMSEIVRAGILSVDTGQTEAAAALGMSRRKTLRRIVLPQAMRVIIPPTGNQTITMLKTTALVLVIALPDLLTSVQVIYSRNFLQIPLLIVACSWFVLLTGLLTIGQQFLERRFGRGQQRTGAVGG
jgi:polar amino acid transport system permease protein